ncbi:hypothetical protein [Lentzea sp. NPDC004782]|uniref:hypothetical protein n=1 Tax=Lentzea sp. NPDC004782 TaxID=3154458 RepID=UPI0033A0A48A
MPAIEFPLRLPRRFELWSYQVSHGVLLLRSAPRADQPTRIDVQFRFTSDLKLPAVLNDLVIDLAGDRYTLVAADYPDGYVVAENLQVAEDDLEAHQPSVFEDERLVPHRSSHLHHFRD